MYTLEEIQRKLKYFQHKELAERAGVTPMTLRNIEKGNGCRAVTLQKISNAIKEIEGKCE